MLRDTRKTANRKTRRRVKFHGIGKDAERLGVHRIHLYLVLKGRRTSHRLLRRYQQLKEAA